jgi:hypothetical protein
MKEYYLNTTDLNTIQNNNTYEHMTLNLFVMMEYKARLKRTHKSESMFKLVFENENDILKL